MWGSLVPSAGKVLMAHPRVWKQKMPPPEPHIHEQTACSQADLCRGGYE